MKVWKATEKGLKEETTVKKSVWIYTWKVNNGINILFETINREVQRRKKKLDNNSYRLKKGI